MLGGGRQHRLDDVLVAGAAAEVALETVAHLLLGGARVVLEQVDRGHDHARRAVAALQAVVLLERALHGVPGAVGLAGQPLDGRDGRRRRPARPAPSSDFTLSPSMCDGARAAVGRVAADGGADPPQALAQVVREEGPRLHLVLVGDAVDLHGHSGMQRTSPGSSRSGQGRGAHRRPEVRQRDRAPGAPRPAPLARVARGRGCTPGARVVMRTGTVTSCSALSATPARRDASPAPRTGAQPVGGGHRRRHRDEVGTRGAHGEHDEEDRSQRGPAHSTRQAARATSHAPARRTGRSPVDAGRAPGRGRDRVGCA